jgi:RNA polymerase sigma factor for flagellar operon FliA
MRQELRLTKEIAGDDERLIDSLRELDWSPRELRRQARAVEDAVQALTMRLARLPEETEVAGELHISVAELQN